MSDQGKMPTIFDLHTEQTRQSAILSSVKEDVSEIKEVLVGKDKRNGLLMDVERLTAAKKQSDIRRSTIKALLWTLFTATIGAIASILTAFFKN